MQGKEIRCDVTEQRKHGPKFHPKGGRVPGSESFGSDGVLVVIGQGAGRLNGITHPLTFISRRDVETGLPSTASCSQQGKAD